jgi:hypothetical protein
MFIGGNRQKMRSELFENFEEDLEVEVDIRALIYIPD